MTLAFARPSRTSLATSLQRGRWDRQLFHLLALAGAGAIIAGSYMTWATFYAGLIARNGVSGHGKYFIGLALAAVLAAILSSTGGVWRGLRWLLVPAGIAIAALALRDLHNLDALVRDPASGFLLPGRGPGLFVVIVGAVILGLSPIVRPVGAAGRADRAQTVTALLAITGVAMLIPGLYGEYYLHVAHGHAHGHTDALREAHVLSAIGLLFAGAASHCALVSWASRR